MTRARRSGAHRMIRLIWRKTANALTRSCAISNIPQPDGATAMNREEATAAADQIGYPVLVRPSYVLGGRGMAIVFDDDDADTLAG